MPYGRVFLFLDNQRFPQKDDWMLGEENDRFGECFAVFVISASSFFSLLLLALFIFLFFSFLASRILFAAQNAILWLANLALWCAPLQCTENTRNCINRMFSPVVRREIEACVELVFEASLLGYKTDVVLLICWTADMLICWISSSAGSSATSLRRWCSSRSAIVEREKPL